MKSLKITLLVAVMLAALTSCTKQDLNEDDLLITDEVVKVLDSGGKSPD